MRNELCDSVDYLFTVAVMSWLQDGREDPAELLRALQLADRLGEAVSRHLVVAGVIESSSAYVWRPVYELMLAPEVERVLYPADESFDDLRALARRERLDQVCSYVLNACRQSPDWEGSRESSLLENLSRRIVQRRIGSRPIPTPRPWSRESIAPLEQRPLIIDES